MWGNVLRWTIRAAVAAGLPQAALRWLKDRFDRAADKVEEKIQAKYERDITKLGEKRVQVEDLLLPTKPVRPNWMLPAEKK